MKTHSVSHGFVVDPISGERIDEVLLTKMDGPSTYTREDIIEVNCHAGLETQARILELIIREGARPAEPGEFTKRAFLSGRIDLTQAEAVMDVINATGKMSAKAAMDQLEGSLSRDFCAVRDELLDLIASFDAVLDFPEHDLEDITAQDARDRLERVLEKLKALENGFEKGRIVRDGITCVITGKPNVGKSSLLNILSRKDSAIVAETPGTTRDLISERINIGGFSLNITDSAGIRKTGDAVEKIGVDIAKRALGKADLVIVVLDATGLPDDNDYQVINLAKCAPRIYMINKIDIADSGSIRRMISAIAEVDYSDKTGRQSDFGTDVPSGTKEDHLYEMTPIAPFAAELSDEVILKAHPPIIESSFITGEGVEKLEEAIIGMFSVGSIQGNNEALLTSRRHFAQVQKSITAIVEAVDAIDKSFPIDMAIIGMRDAASAIGEITGEDCFSEIIDRIFSSFCVGK